MQKEISEQQFWQAYDSVPAELQDAIFSEETAKTIFNSCIDNGVKDERISQVAKNVGDVLLGLLSPERLQPVLELDLNLEPQTAENICQAIYNAIFEPVRPQLAELYLRNGGEVKENRKEIRIETKPKKEVPLPKKTPDISLKEENKKPALKRPAAARSSSDSYRESIGG